MNYDLPNVSFPEKLEDIAKAVVTAGLWADSLLEKSLIDPDVRREIEDSVESKGNADVATYIDKKSENIMAAVMRKNHYEGGLFGEEGIVENPLHEQTLVLDGLDGTECARSRPAGIDSAYGPSAGIFYEKDGVIMPLRGAVFLPRQMKGYFGSTETGDVFEFKVGKKGDSFEVTGTKKLKPFDQNRTDVKYLLAFFLEEGENFPNWFANLYNGANQAGDQNILHATGAQVDYLARLIENCGEREQHLGTSAAIGAKGTRLHDIMGLAPAVIALGGVVGNLDGYQLGKDKEFLPDLAGAKKKHLIPKTPIGPVISVQNEKIYQRVRDFMLNE